jgi:hypothetical protein
MGHSLDHESQERLKKKKKSVLGGQRIIQWRELEKGPCCCPNMASSKELIQLTQLGCSPGLSLYL